MAFNSTVVNNVAFRYHRAFVIALCRFDPDRFSADKMEKLPEFAFEPFGFAGKRKCPGYRFSLAEVSVLLAKLLGSDMKLDLAPGQTVTMTYDFTCKPAEEIWMTAEQRN